MTLPFTGCMTHHMKRAESGCATCDWCARKDLEIAGLRLDLEVARRRASSPALESDLFAARQAVITEGVARNASDALAERAETLLEEARAEIVSFGCRHDTVCADEACRAAGHEHENYGEDGWACGEGCPCIPACKGHEPNVCEAAEKAHALVDRIDAFVSDRASLPAPVPPGETTSLPPEIREILRDVAHGVHGPDLSGRAAAAIVKRDLCPRCAGTGQELLDTGGAPGVAWGTCHGCSTPPGADARCPPCECGADYGHTITCPRRDQELLDFTCSTCKRVHPPDDPWTPPEPRRLDQSCGGSACVAGCTACALETKARG